MERVDERTRRKKGTEDGQGKQTTSKEALASAAQWSTGIDVPDAEQPTTARAREGPDAAQTTARARDAPDAVDSTEFRGHFGAVFQVNPIGHAPRPRIPSLNI